MSSFACSWAWLIGGLLGGWLLWQLFDRFFRRDGEAAGMRARRDLEAATTRLAALQAELDVARTSLASRDDEITRLTTELADWKAKYDGVKDEVDTAKVATGTAVAATAAAVAAASAGHAKLQAELTATQETLATLRREHAASIDAHAALQREHAASVDAHTTIKRERAESVDAHATLKREHATLLDAQTTLRNDVTASAAAVTKLRAELATATASLSAESIAHGRLKVELQAAQDRHTAMIAERDTARAALHAKSGEVAGLVSDLAACRARHDELSAEVSKASASAATATAFAAAAEFGFTPRRNGTDDLLIIEGIGPKINELLLKEGIDTFVALAVAPVDRVQSILTAAGPNFRLANPASWARQAAMCEAGAWSELRAYQDTLRAGVDGARAAKLREEQWLATAKAHGFAPRRGDRDDLTIVEGIGPKINELLLAGGIDTFAALASAPVTRVQAILDAAGPNFRIANPASWARQSAMCEQGQWPELRALQDSLRAGVDTERGA